MSDIFCPTCGEECAAKPEDQGVGPYEFWGAEYVDTHMVMVSDCCEAPLEDLSYAEWHQEQLEVRADAEYDRRREDKYDA